MSEKIVAILFSLAILGQAGILRAFAGSWMVPGSLFGLFWFGYTFIPLVMLWDVPVGPWGIIYIFFACMFFSLTGYAFQWKSEFHKVSLKPFADNFYTPVIRVLFYAMSGLIIICMLINLLIQGMTLTSILTQPLNVAGKITRLRYDHALEPNIFNTVAIALHYPTVILGSLLYFMRVHQGATRIFLLTLIFFPASLLMLLHGDKGSLLFVISLFFGAFLTYKIRKGTRKIFILRDFYQSFLGGGVVLFLIFCAFLSRRTEWVSGAERPIWEDMIRMIGSYTAGHVYAFSDWFAEYINKSDGISNYIDNLGGYGFYTFMSIAKLLSLGATKIPHGIYEEYFSYGEIIYTNIYTIFRGLINDYGIIGSFFALTIIGYISNRVTLSLLRSDDPVLSAPLFIFIIGFFYTSFIISLFVWNSPFVGLFLTCLFLKLNSMYLIRKREKSSGRSLCD